MARQMSESQEAQTRTGTSRKATRSPLGRALPASFLRAITGGDSGESSSIHTQSPHPTDPTRG